MNNDEYEAVFAEAQQEAERNDLRCHACNEPITGPCKVCFEDDDTGGGFAVFCDSCYEAMQGPPDWCDSTRQPVPDDEIPF